MSNALNPYSEGTIAYRIWERNKNDRSIHNASEIELKIIHLRIDGQTIKNVSALSGRSIQHVRNILQKYKITPEGEHRTKSNSEMIVEALG